VIVQQAYKFELRPQPRHLRHFARVAGCCRYVWNRMLAEQKANHEAGGKYISFPAACRLLTQWRQEPQTAWLAEAPVHALQQALKNLDLAFKAFFAKRAAFPTFKKKGKAGDGFREQDPKVFAVDATNGRVRLPKLGWVRYRKSQDVLGTPKQVNVTRRADRWYVSIQTERTVPDPVHPHAGSVVGLDVGVAKLATLSTGEVFPPVNSFARHRDRLAALQRRLARKEKFSANWKKLKARITKLHAKIANVRNDYLHKVTHTVTKNHGVVCVEDLQVKSMSASAAGTVEQPGKNVRAKSGLNRSILDQGWFELRRQLDYKLRWRGGRLVVVPPQYTSQRCSTCGHVAAESRPTQAAFVCVRCGHAENADVNAANNLCAAGQAVSAFGGSPAGGPLRKEPTEAIRSNRGSDDVGILGL
jgi:putative transposase